MPYSSAHVHAEMLGASAFSFPLDVEASRCHLGNILTNKKVKSLVQKCNERDFMI